MAGNLRAQYARVCVQVDLNKPLVTQFKIGKHAQKVRYEGVSALCFTCGCVGHRQTKCRMLEGIVPKLTAAQIEQSTRGIPTDQSLQGILASVVAHVSVHEEEGYGEWVYAKKKKPWNSKPNSQQNSPNNNSRRSP